MELGCSTLLYGNFPLEVALRGIKKAGYGAIELAAMPGMSDHMPQAIYESEALLKDLRKQIEDSGLAIESIGASTDLLNPEARARFVKLMRAGHILGAPAITSGSGGKADDEETFHSVEVMLNELAPVAHETGVKVSVKPHVGGAVYSTKTSLRMMQLVDTSAIGLNVDASHLWRTPELEIPEETIPSLLPYLVTARIRDTLSRERPIGPVPTQIPGGGALNLKAVVDVFKQKAGLKYITLEIVGTHANHSVEQIDDVVQRCYDALAPMVSGG
jgi:sugar phosphate isomerase/epimerase